jgi:VanZ family protein
MRRPKDLEIMFRTEKTGTKKAIIFWCITIGYMSLIFYLSSRNFHLPELPDNSDKFIHACIYFPLAFLFYLSLNRSGIKRYVFLAAVILAVFYGVTDEFHQAFVPGRDSSIGDAFADFAGALLGGAGASFFRT